MKYIFIILILLSAAKANTQCETASVALPDESQPVVNPSLSYCVSFTVDPTLIGHPIGVSMNLEHSWQGDLSIRVHACGNTLMLLTRPGGGSCNAGAPFGNSASINGNFSFSDTGTNPDNGLPFGGGSFGLSGDPCGVNTVNSFAALAAACGDSPYTFEVCITDHAFGDSGFASSITPLFIGAPVCGCTDPAASNYDPQANVDDGSCEYDPCSLSLSVSSTPEICDQSNGTAQITVSGGSGDYIYLWNTTPPGTTNPVSDLASGNYSVTVTDSADPDCTASIMVTIGVEDGFTANFTTVDPDCLGNNGIITLSTSGSQGPFFYDWSHDPDLDGPEATGLNAGFYSVIITDLNTGCIEEVEIDLFEPDVFTASYFIIDTDCDTGLGGISVITQGGSGNFSYSWSHMPGLNSNEALNLQAGVYQVTITDNITNCTEEIIDIEIVELIPIEATFDITHTTCGLNNGAITLEIVSGAGPFIFNWSNPNIQGQFGDNLPAGVYVVTITDESTLCEEIIEVTINNSLELEITFNNSNSTCGETNGSIQLFINNGSGFYTINWLSHPFLTGSEVNDLAPGLYSVEVTDDLEGCVSSIDVIIEDSNPLELTENIIQTTCGEDNGVITIFPNITGTFNYQWSHTSSNSNTASSLAPGLYFVTVTETINGCIVTAEYEIIDSDPLFVTFNSTETHCGGNNGEINLSVDNGSGFYLFTWSHDPFLNEPSAIGLEGGQTYFVTITDVVDGCESILEIDILPSDLLEANTIIGPIICGPDDASMTVEMVNGSGNFTYEWQDFPGINLPQINNVGPGTYNLNVIDNISGCSLDLTFEIEDVNPFSIDCSNVFDESTIGENDGAVEIETISGTAPFNVEITNGTDQISLMSFDYFIYIDGLMVGNWDVFIIDGNGCESTCSFYINSGNCGLEVELVNIIVPLCVGSSDGSISVNAINGTGNITYNWLGTPVPNTTNMATNLPSNIYTVVATDEDGCQAELVIQLDDPPPIDLSCSVINHESTFGQMDGEAIISFTNGLAPFQIQVLHNMELLDSIELYEWNLNLENLSAGTYEISFSDNSGCTGFCTFEVLPGDCAIGLQIDSISHPKCFGDSSGFIQISATEEASQYEILWTPIQPGNPGFTVAGIPAGVYTVELIDTLGCTDTLSIELIDPTPLEVLCTINNHETSAGESDGSFTVMPEGEGGPFHLIIRKGDDIITNTLLQGQLNFEMNNLSPGVYNVLVTDTNDCLAECQITILPGGCLLSMEIVGQQNPTCYGVLDGFIEVRSQNATGNITYTVLLEEELVGNTAILNNIGPGNYIFIATDEVGCTDTLTIPIVSPLPPVISCTAIPESMVGLSDGAVIIETDQITFPYDIYLSGASIDTILNITDSILNINQLPIGNYQIHLVDFNGCEATCQFTVLNINCSISLDETMIHHPSCPSMMDGYIEVMVSGNLGPLTFNWTGPEVNGNFPNQNGLPAGNFTVNIRDSLGCEIDQSIILKDPEPLEITTDINHPTCGESNGVLNITVQGGSTPYSISWQDGSNDQFNRVELSADIYEFTITDQNSCKLDTSIALNMQDEPLIDLIAIDHLSCYGDENGSLQISVESDFPIVSIMWSNGTENTLELTNLSAGNYVVTIVDENNCQMNATYNIEQPEPLDINTVSIHPDCKLDDGQILLEIDGGTAPYFMDGSVVSQPVIQNLGPGLYTYHISDANSCSIEVNVELVRPEGPVADAGDDQSLTCIKESVEIGNRDNYFPERYDYEWTRQEDGLILESRKSYAEVAKSGTYVLSINDIENGCTDSDTVEVHLNNFPIEFVGIEYFDISCFGNRDGIILIDEILGGTPPFEINVNNQPENQLLENLSPGLYNIQIKDVFGCTWPDQQIVIHEPPPLAINAPNIIYSHPDSIFEIPVSINTNERNIANIIWENEEGQICSNCGALSLNTSSDIEQQYTITVETTTGCLAQFTIKLRLIETRAVFVPNAFSPNGDGTNDYFEIFGDNRFDSVLSMQIFDKWGSAVYAATKHENSPNTHLKWDGTYRSQQVAPGEYVYVIEVQFVDGYKEVIYGSVTVIR